MTDGEKYYIEHIAPKLLEIGKDCEKHGFSFLAQCEFDKDQRAYTQFLGPNYSMSILTTYLAISSNGNVDSLWLNIQKHARKYGHSSAFLSVQGIPENPKIQILEVENVAKHD